MLRAALFLCVWLSFRAVLGQQPDSALRQRAEPIIDTLAIRAVYLEAGNQKRTDSLLSHARLSKLRDSVVISEWSISLRREIEGRFSPDALARSTDSLRMFGVTEPAIAKRTDSLLRRKADLLSEVNIKQATLQQNVNIRYADWSDAVRRKYNLDSSGVRIPSLSAPSSMLPASNLPAANVPAAPDLHISEIPTVPSLDAADFSSLGMSPELSAVGGGLTTPTTPQLAGWKDSFPPLPDAAGDMTNQVAATKELTANPSGVAEKAASNVAEVGDAVQVLDEAEQVKKQAEAAEQLKDPSALKQQASDHFAGKEAELAGAMNQMAKFKKKYSSLGSLSEVKKNNWLPKNGLKGKPFKERFRPGLNLGVRSNSDTILLDFYPNAAYRITGRLEAGLGAVYRVRVSSNPFGFDQRNPVWGFSLFAVVKTFKSIFIRLETDVTDHFKQGTTEQPSYHDWMWNFYTGVQTNFKLSRRLSGNVQMLYSFDSSLKDGFPEKLLARVGVQCSLK